MATRSRPVEAFDKENWGNNGKLFTKEAPNSATRKPLQAVSVNQTIPASPLLNTITKCSSAFLAMTPTQEEEDLFSPPSVLNEQIVYEEKQVDESADPQAADEAVEQEDDEEFKNFLENQAAEDFKDQMTIICETLRDTQANWTARSKALHKIQTLVKVLTHIDSHSTQR